MFALYLFPKRVKKIILKYQIKINNHYCIPFLFSFFPFMGCCLLVIISGAII